MASGLATVPQLPASWRFRCPLAYVLVDGKQIANGDVDLVVKCEVGKSPASASRHVNQPTPNRHLLMVYVAKEAEPKVSLSLDGFLPPAGKLSDPASVRYSANKRRLLITGSSRLTYNPIHDLRFSKGKDLLDVVARLNRISLICADDDKDVAEIPTSQIHAVSRNQTSSPQFVLSAEALKSGRVMSPLQRRPDGSTPAFCLVQVPRSASRLSHQEWLSQEMSQPSQGREELVLPTLPELKPPCRPASVPKTAKAGSIAQLEDIPTWQPDRPSRPRIVLKHKDKNKKKDTIPTFDEWSSQPASQPVKRRRISHPTREKLDSSEDTISHISDAQISHTQSQNANSGTSEQLSQHSRPPPASHPQSGQLPLSPPTPQPQLAIHAPEVQLHIQEEVNAAMAKHLRESMRQTMIWEELRAGFFTDVEMAGDDDDMLKILVENYEMDLTIRLGISSYS